MLGVISSYDSQRRCGYIKEKDKNALFYFGKNSVMDENLPLIAGQPIKFEVYRMNGKQPVAVRIALPNLDAPPNVPNQYSKMPTPDHMKATVIWFSEEKKYGFVRCDTNPSVDAHLHQKVILKHGITSLHSGQRLKVKLLQDKAHKNPSVVDVIIESGYRGAKTNMTTEGRNHDAGQRMGEKNPSFLQHKSEAPPRRNPSSTDHVQPRLKNPTRPMPSALYNYNECTAIPSNANSMYSVRPPNPARYGSNVKPPVVYTNSPASVGKQKKLHQTTLTNHFSPFRSKIITYRSNPECDKINQQIYQKQGLLKTLDISKLPDGGKRLQDQIQELQVKLKKLQVAESGDQDNKPPYRKNSGSQLPAIDTVVDLTTVPDEKYSYSLYQQPEKESSSGDNYYGGRMTVKRLDAVKKVTADAIEKLHTSLDTCPPPSEELEDPSGLLVNLMVHQKQALAWLVWREKQSVSGGILADDMGLGKTLTMIALVLKQVQTKQAEELKESSKKEDESSPSDAENGGKEESGEAAETDSKTGEETKQPENDFVASESTLIVAPASLIYHWENEIRNRCTKGLLSVHLYHGNAREKDAEKLSEFDVVITTYDIVRRSRIHHQVSTDKTKKASTKTKGDDTLFLVKWRRIILDEAHQIRNYKSQTSEAACSLNALSRWALSGTPVQNQETDMYAMLKFLHCHPFDEYKLWKNQVSNKTERGQKRLKTLVSSLVLRREKSQKGINGKPLVSLPTRHFETHVLKLNTVEQEVYKKLKSESQAAYKSYEMNKKHQGQPVSQYKDEVKSDDGQPGKKASASTLLVMLLRMRQCCGHLSLLKESFNLDLLENEKQQIAVEDLFQSMSLDGGSSAYNSFAMDKYADKEKSEYFQPSSSSSKIKFVMDTLHKLKFEQPSDKCVIISQWTSMLKILTHHLVEANISFAVIDGGVTARKRMELVDEFNRNPVMPKVMLVSLQAGGVGLNLIGGNHLFLLDMHWNPALEKQAFDRIYRVGQKKEVYVHKFVVEDTVEEQILKLQERKLSIAKAVMDGADTENKVKLTLADMKMLFDIHS